MTLCLSQVLAAFGTTATLGLLTLLTSRWVKRPYVAEFLRFFGIVCAFTGISVPLGAIAFEAVYWLLFASI